MSESSDISEAFEDVIDAGFGGTITLGSAGTCPCIILDGIDGQTDGRRWEVSATVTARRVDIGSIPKPNTQVKLDFDGANHQMAVTEDTIRETRGGLYTFTIAG